MSSSAGFDHLLRPRADIVYIDWASDEARLNTALPDDYKAFVASYEPNVDDFLWILHPSTNKNLDLVTQAEEQVAAQRTMRGTQPREVPYPLYPEPGGLLPWGVTDNGDVCFWITNGDPSRWVVAINESRGPEWYEFPASMTEFVFALLAQEVRVPFFPDDFPSVSRD